MSFDFDGDDFDLGVTPQGEVRFASDEELAEFGQRCGGLLDMPRSEIIRRPTDIRRDLAPPSTYGAAAIEFADDEDDIIRPRRDRLERLRRITQKFDDAVEQMDQVRKEMDDELAQLIAEQEREAEEEAEEIAAREARLDAWSDFDARR